MIFYLGVLTGAILMTAIAKSEPVGCLMSWTAVGAVFLCSIMTDQIQALVMVFGMVLGAAVIVPVIDTHRTMCHRAAL